MRLVGWGLLGSSLLGLLALLLLQPTERVLPPPTRELLTSGRPTCPHCTRAALAHTQRSAANESLLLGVSGLGRTTWSPLPRPPDFHMWEASMRHALSQDASSLRTSTSALLVLTAAGTNGSKGQCTAGCSGRGRCDQLAGRCICRHGYWGEACEMLTPQRCNDPRPTCRPHFNCNEWTRLISRCSGECDLSSNRCTCGSRAKFPSRSLFMCEWQGVNSAFNWRSPGWAAFGVFKIWQIWASPQTVPFVIESKLGRPRLEQLWRDRPAAWRQELAWCEMQPEQWKAAKRLRPAAAKCPCYENQDGHGCELALRSFCLNQCSGRGVCDRAFCVCDRGWTGSDCSIPIAPHAVLHAKSSERKAWRPGQVGPSEEGSQGHAAISGGVAGAERTGEQGGREHAEGGMRAIGLRPSIYVYELPTSFNSWLLETRLVANDCVYRMYKLARGANSTTWHDYAFGMEMALHELLLASPHRTLNPEAADFFFVPVYGGCYISRFFRPTAIHNLFFRPTDRWQPAPVRGNEHYTEALRWIQQQYPFWRRKGGADHIFAFPHDEGACVAPIEMANAIFLTSWGRLESPPKNATTVMPEHSWHVPSKIKDMYASRTCYDPSKDILMPVFTSVGILRRVTHILPREAQPRRHLLFTWRGQHLPEFPKYSMGIRHQVISLWGDKPEWRAKGVLVSAGHSRSYFDEIKSSVFCGVFPGNGWGHLELPILLGCIPVVVQDDILVPFENVLDFNRFGIRLRRADLPRLPEILGKIPKKRIKTLQKGLSRVWERFTYSSLARLEEQRACRERGQCGEQATVSRGAPALIRVDVALLLSPVSSRL